MSVWEMEREAQAPARTRAPARPRAHTYVPGQDAYLYVMDKASNHVETIKQFAVFQVASHTTRCPILPMPKRRGVAHSCYTVLRDEVQPIRAKWC